MKKNFFGALTAGFIVVFFCLLLLWHDPLVFWNDDYELSILPVFADVARSWNEGHWPLLSPYSWVCSNLAGEFQYGTFSIFVNAAVVLIWKFPLTFPQQAATLSIVHLFVLAAGAFMLARDRKFSFALSIFIALAATLSGWIVCWGATDWFGALGAFAWLPWAWWALERALDRQRTKWKVLWPAPFVYLVVTGGFPYTVVMLLVLVAWFSIKTVIETKDFFSVVPMWIGVALGFGLAAPAWLAIFDYVNGSARETNAAFAHRQWVVPFSALPSLILPCWTVKWTDFGNKMVPHTSTELGCGLVPVTALIAGLILRGRELARKIEWELLLLLFVLLLCMLPTAGLFRWSFRWLPFFHLVLVICAAEALRPNQGDGQKPSAPLPLIALFLVGIITIAMSIFATTGHYAFPLAWILLSLAGIWFVADILLGRSDARDWLPAGVTFVALLATYFCVPPNCGVPKYNLSQELTQSSPLDPQRLYLSIYPPPETEYRVENKSGPIGRIVRPGSTSMWSRLRFVNGYSPIVPAGIARDLKAQIHGEIDPYTARELLEQQAGPAGDLATIGIDGIIVASEFDMAPQPASEWSLVVVTKEGRVYHRTGAPFAPVRSVKSIRSRPNEEFAQAKISGINDLRNRVEADVEVPDGEHSALLTFSRPYFRGYHAHLAGKKLFVDAHRGLFPIVELPAGAKGRVVLRYRPAWLIYGGALSILCAVIWFTGLGIAARTTSST